MLPTMKPVYVIVTELLPPADALADKVTRRWSGSIERIVPETPVPEAVKPGTQPSVLDTVMTGEPFVSVAVLTTVVVDGASDTALST